jgi:superfamily II DNA or RNA helicase
MSSAPLPFDSDQLRHVIPPVYLERGKRYLKDSRVLTVDHDVARGLVTGRVRGSGGRIYQCIVQLGQQSDGMPMVVGQCSCPVGYNCKHVAAVLLSLDQHRDKATSPPQGRALSLDLRGWLDRVERAGDIPEDEPHRLLYLVRPDEHLGLARTAVRAVRVRRLQAGGYGKPQEFNLLNQSRACFVGRDDQRILGLIAIGRGSGDGKSVRLDDLIGADIIQAIALTGRGHFKSVEGPALKAAGPVAGQLVWRLGEDARLRVVLESERSGLVILPITPPWYVDPETGDCGPLETGLGDREAGLLAAAPAVDPESAAALEEAVRKRGRGLAIPSPSRPERRRVDTERPTPRLRLGSIDRVASSVDRYWGLIRQPEWVHHALLDFRYGGASVDPRDRKPVLRRVEEGLLLEVGRDLDAERAFVDALQALGFKRSTDDEDASGMAFERLDEDTWVGFMQDELPPLQREGWRIEIEPGFHFRLAEVGDWDVEIAEGEGGRWLDIGLGVEVDGERLDLLPLLLDMIQRYQVDLSTQTLARMPDDARLRLRLSDGRLILMPVQRLRPILSTLIELYDPDIRLGGAHSNKGHLRLSRVQAAQLAELEAADPHLRWRGGESVRDWGRRLRDFAGLEAVAPPAGLAAELRPYQRQGLDWLQFLREYELGGVLADDMGLGKTIQTLAHLLVEKESGRNDRPSLVVAPTSILFNWRREAERFAPALKVLSLHGADRHGRFGSIADHDLVLTTYPLLPRDLGALGSLDFHLLILDEAQNIKNPRSKAAQAARGLRARHRLCLTGTPMENHLGELWSLLDFLMPELLGDERRFRRLFRTPVERHGDEVRKDELRRRVAPFLLRRTKEAVAAELPPKSEIIREVPLAADQRDLYETLRLALHEKVRAEVARKGLARSGIIILDALLKLRQVCCDPRLVSLESARRVKGSAKLELLMTLLPELLEEGRRVLLFSQFTSMLALIEEELTKIGLCADQHFVKLTGQTRNRDRPVDRFQAGEVPLFLISLKAGGTGLNLTAADTVIHYDPWWNPAAERQATDRAHRIGQDKPVFVYKLLTEGTVEQRVADLQARKQALADAMLEGGGAAAGILSPDDLDLLFAPLSAA